MTGIHLAAELCSGHTDGCQLQSTDITFTPSAISSQKQAEFTADAKTAGATTLLAQVSLPYALLGNQATTLLDLKGGTNAAFAPQVEYYSQVFLPMLHRLGASVKCDVIRKGYYPKGGGHLQLKVPSVKQLQPIILTDFGAVKSVNIYSSVAGVLNVKLAQQMAHAAKDQLVKHLGKQVPIHVDAFKENSAVGNGNTIVIVAETSTGCLLGSGGIGSRAKSGSELGNETADELICSLNLGACVDQYLQDQLIIYMALAKGTSRIKCGPLTLHTKTAIYMAESMSEAKFRVEESADEKDIFFIECTGIGYTNNTA